MYNNAANKARNAPSTMQRDANTQKADRVAKGPNNVYADKNGNVHRQTSNGWQSRDQGQWKGSQGSTSRDLNRDAQARQNGASRSSSSYGGSRGGSYGGSRGGSYGGSRGGGGGRGGGGRR